MKLLVLNPNSSVAVTRSIDACLEPVRATTRHDIVCMRLPDAPVGIETDDDVRAVTPMVEAFVADCAADAIVVACFSDPGVREGRAVSSVPVVGIAEAAYCAALPFGPRFGVVSMGKASIVRHAHHIEALGLTRRLAGDRSIDMSVEQGNSAPGAAETIAAVARRLVDEDGADTIILGCAGLGIHRAPLQRALGLTVIDPVQAGVGAALAALDFGYRTRG